MYALQSFEMICRVSRIVTQLEQSGMRIELGDDFKKYFAYRHAQLERQGICPTFDVSQSFIDRSNGFWICGFDQSNELIHTQAVRLLSLTDHSLDDHLRVHSQKYVIPGTTPDPDQTFFEGPGALSEISGRVAYQGDFWIPSRGLGGPRSQGITNMLGQLSLEMIHAAWKPDHLFAFVPKRLAEKGLNLRYGYNHCELGSWIGPDQQVTEEEYFVWMSQKELSKKLKRETIAQKFQPNATQESVVPFNAGA